MREPVALELRHGLGGSLALRRGAWAAAGVDYAAPRKVVVAGRSFADPLVKRVFDVVVPVAVLPVALLLLLACAAAVKAASPGPAFVPKLLTGRGGRRFRTRRFRTGGEGGAAATVEAFLRSTRLDRLPELVDVLRGTMSLVGPRPGSAEPGALPLWHTGRLEVKPGITGLAQISRGRSLGPDEAARLDIAYARTWTVGLDARILARSGALAWEGAWRGVRGLAPLARPPRTRAAGRAARPALSIPRLAAGGLVVADVAACALAMTVSYLLRFGLQLGSRSPVAAPPPLEYAKLFVVAAAAIAVIAGIQQLYRPDPPYTRLEEAGLVARAVTLGTALALGAAFFYREIHFSRLALVYFWATATLFVAATHVAVRRWLVRRHARGLDLSRTVVVGRPSAHLLDRLQRDPEFGLDLVGWLGPEGAEALPGADVSDAMAGPLVRSARCSDADALPPPAHLGDVGDAWEVLPRTRPERVMIVEHGLTHAELLETIDACERHDIHVQLVPPIYDLLIDPTDLTFVNGVPALRIDEVRSRPGQRIAKRALDVVGSAFLLLFLGPAMLAIAVAIRRSSPGPVLFRQTRGGRNGRPFEMLKFRTMVPDAEAKLASVVDLDALDQPVFKVVDDPRVTPVGRWLRRFSLDELPQLLNVLKGDMTLVGPRPEELRLVERYDIWQRRRLKMKPGITGLQQVVARGHLADLNRRVRLDAYYTRKQSLFLDLIILLRTVWAVVSGRGAT